MEAKFVIRTLHSTKCARAYAYYTLTLVVPHAPVVVCSRRRSEEAQLKLRGRRRDGEHETRKQNAAGLQVVGEIRG